MEWPCSRAWPVPAIGAKTWGSGGLPLSSEQTPSEARYMDGSSSTKTPTETIHVKTRAVSCDGGDGAYGHPKVYLRIAPDQPGQQIMCPYCSRLFVLEAGAGVEAH